MKNLLIWKDIEEEKQRYKKLKAINLLSQKEKLGEENHELSQVIGEKISQFKEGEKMKTDRKDERQMLARGDGPEVLTRQIPDSVLHSQIKKTSPYKGRQKKLMGLPTRD